MKSILLPPMNPSQEAKAKRLLDMIGEYMGSNITVESVISMKANFPDDRPDIEAILKRLAGNKTGFQVKKANGNPTSSTDPDPSSGGGEQ